MDRYYTYKNGMIFLDVTQFHVVWAEVWTEVWFNT